MAEQSSYAVELAVARQAARDAANIVLGVYRTNFAVEHKVADDPVTAADRLANAAIVERLNAHFPTDAVLAEETAARPTPAERAGRCWFVDPLDGTREFVTRLGEFCVMIGLAVAGRPVLGVLAFPSPTWPLPGKIPASRWHMLWGVVGQGVFLEIEDGTTFSLPSPLSPAAELTLLVSRARPDPRLPALLEALGGGRGQPSGSVGVKVARLIFGEARGYWHPAAPVPSGSGPCLWDLCAPEAVARAIGLTFSCADGQAVAYDAESVVHDRGLMVADPTFHKVLVDVVSRL